MSQKNDRSAESIRRSAERMKRARSRPAESPLRGLSAFGVIGWSIVVPTVGGAFLGLWLDQVAPQNFSWPIALILGGVVTGSLIAWRWIEKESADPQDESAEAENDKSGDS